MYRRFSLLVVLSVVLLLPVSCKEDTDKLRLPKDKMEKILLDINLAEIYSTMVKDSLNKKGAKNADSLAAYYKIVFSHHNITQEQFWVSLSWYKSHPDELDTVYNNMIPVAMRWQGDGAAK